MTSGPNFLIGVMLRYKNFYFFFENFCKNFFGKFFCRKNNFF
jgi:hypothetical protein